MRLLQLGGGHPEGISGPQVTEAAREGDPAALRCFQIVGSWLGQGMADLAAIMDPGCFIIGGGVSEAGDLLIATAVGWTVPAVAAFFAIGAFVGGFAILVMRMGDEPRDGNGPDDGAVV